LKPRDVLVFVEIEAIEILGWTKVAILD